MNIEIYNKLILERKPDIEVLMKAARPEPDDPEYKELKDKRRGRVDDKYYDTVLSGGFAKMYAVMRNTDGSGDYDGDIYIVNHDIESLEPLKGLRIVTGTFDCSDNFLTSLKYAPKKCKVFDCRKNSLKSLEYAPKSDYFYCSSNVLTSLEYAPKICKDFNCSHNVITSLKGGVEKCDNFYCQHNQLTSLEGAPTIKYTFNCSKNMLRSFEGAPVKCHYFDCSACFLTSLKGVPQECYYFDCSFNVLNSLEGGPIEYETIHCIGNNVPADQLLKEHEERIRNMK